jgi:hypothetical protein
MTLNNLTPIDVINLLRKGEANAHISVTAQEIENLKEELTNIDYKTIKNTQYERMGKELPYSWEEIYNESEAIRIQIREKEQEILNLMGLITPVEEIKE